MRVGVVSLPDNRLGIYIPDVSWHGVGAALLSFALAHLLSPTVEGSRLTEHAGAGLPVGMMDEEFGLDRISAAFRAWSDDPLKDDISLLAIVRLG